MPTLTPAPQGIAIDTVVSIVTEAFIGLFGEYELAPILSAPPADPELTSMAAVSIGGEWSGQVRLECSQEFSAMAASRVLQVGSVELSAKEIHDVLGELTNIIGGTIKSLLPGPSHLSLPTSGQRPAEDAGHSPSAVELCRAHFTWRGQPFTVTITTL